MRTGDVESAGRNGGVLSAMSLSFGIVLRAARLGYHHCPVRKCFIRISPLSGKLNNISLIKVELAPEHKLDFGKGDGKGTQHYCWWDDPRILDLSPALSPESIGVVDCYQQLLLSDEGTEVGHAK